MLIFDTSAVIEWLKGNKALQEVSEEIAISSITIYEMLWTSSKRRESVKKAVDRFINRTLSLDVTTNIAREAGSIKMKLLASGKDKPMADILIAATAKVNGSQLYSFDSDFEQFKEVTELNLRFFEMDND